MPGIKKQLVVDGWIENGGYSMVILTYNTAFFSNIDSASLRNLVASETVVTVSDSSESENLTFMPDTNYFPPYVNEGAAYPDGLIGAEGKTYYLTVFDETDSLTLHAVTTIPPNRPVVDSAWMEYVNDNDTMGILKVKFTDNPNEKNYYRTFTKTGKSAHFVPTFFSCFSDQYFNGKTVTLSLNKGSENQLSPISNIYFHKGDTITIKLSAIDKASYNFWLAYEDAVLNASSPFSSDHNQLVSNTDKCLGIWCGYNSSYYSLIAK